MKHYPIFLDLAGRPVLVAGGGAVALRKARGLVEAGAQVTVVAPRCVPEFASLRVRVLARRAWSGAWSRLQSRPEAKTRVFRPNYGGSCSGFCNTGLAARCGEKARRFLGAVVDTGSPS